MNSREGFVVEIGAMDHVSFILSTSANYFNLNQHEKPFDESYVRDFLENEGQRVLSASLNDSKKSIQFQNKIPNEYQNVLLFYKNAKTDPSQRSDLGMLTLEGGIVKSIYNSISSIFVPGALNKNECSTDLVSLIENLQTNLSVSLGVAETGITSIKDEIYFWRQKSEKAATKSDKEAARIFSEQLDNLNGIIGDFMKLKATLKLKNLEDLMDRTQYILDELWRVPNFQYPQNRMISIIDVLSSMIVSCCVDDMNQQEDVWSSSSMNLNETIGHVMDIMNNWIQICDSLTRLFWTNCEQHAWIGKPYIPSLMTKFKLRVEDILDIKQVHKQISILSTEDETIDLKSRDYFHSFRDINIFDTTPIGEKYWTTAKMKFEQSLSNIDEKIAMNIKYSIQNALNNPRQVIYIFSKYENILKRQKIKDALRIECDHLHQAVLTFVVQLHQSLADTKKNIHRDDEEVSPLVSEIKWLKVIEYQVQQVNQICLNVLYDREDYEELKKNAQEFQTEMETNLKQNFDQWCEQSSASVVSGELVLKDNEPVVKFEKKDRQLMTVTYNPKLLIFCQDIRYLRNFGFNNIPTDLVKYGTIGRKYIKYAKNLQQISNFHNTIGDRIIPCQRPIMLKNAMELSNLVKSQSVSWNDEDSVKKYILVLQDAINTLSRDNNLLSSYHENFKKSIMKLVNTDLLKQSNVWKEELKTLRDSIAMLERKGYSNLQLFRLHWDYQLYKALEHQLILFLIDSKEKLPDINIDIVFRQQQLQFRPTLEEIRYEYYSQLRKYVEMPLHFHGFSESSNKIFRVMVERNRSRFKSLYDRAERNFQRLCEFRDLWLPWVSIGCVNLETLCQVHLSSWEHWDRNFKSCKNFSQKIAKIQNSEERIDCFVVNVAPVRSHIEYIARSFWETLSISLRSSILGDNSTLHEYITTALNVLQHIPNEESGIISASFKYEKIVEDLPRMTELLKSVQSKNTCLAGWCKETVGSLDSLVMQWEKLLPLIENHHLLLQGQLEVIKESLLGKINNLNDEAEKFLIKWEDTLKDLEANADADFEIFKDRKRQWNEFLNRRDGLIAECEKFNATFTKDLNEKFLRIEDDIKRHGEQWTIFEEFLVDYDAIEQEEWSIYRRKPYIFADFLSKWESQTGNMISVPAMRIKKQIENYRSVMPTLTMLQSDSLSDKHWANIFNNIGLPPKSYHDIKLYDVLKHAGKLTESANEIKVIVHQAYSEQIVRQAITELEQWGVIANLKLFTHVDSKSETLMLIKDFQEALNKIGDNQCLLQSAKNTAAIDSFTDQIELWETKLNILSYILNNLSQIQKKWIYLEPIFTNGTLRSGDTSFHRIDKDFRYIMRDIGSNPKVISLCKINNIQMIIESLLNQLQHCQNTLTTYMTGKRDLFPRFYFLSDDDLLEILGQSSKENILQKHIAKLFPGVSKLELQINDKVTKIRCIKSAESDNIQLLNEISTAEAVETWLNSLDKEIKNTLKHLIKLCYQRNEMNVDAIEKFPMQALCLINSVSFTTKLEKAITTMSLPAMLTSLKGDISSFSMLLQKTANQLTQLKIRALLFDMVHHVTTVEYLIKHNVTNLNDWHWLQQIKFYYNARTEGITIKVVNAEFQYSYEFLGNYNKLVYTTLTHNCYLTLTQAMYLGLGGNPFGPAGTGKTECVKSLGAMLGRMVLVFNCNENIDTSAMSLILTGISRCGAWACFDEFNRLQEETLSAIAMLIQPLQVALKEKQEFVDLMDKNIPLNPHACIFVTLNPADEDYGGRNQLPSNLQALFRPIVMQQPEPKEIAKVMLFIEGFKNAEEIGRRIVELFDLSNKLLSPQRHYDWGLRELKTVLSACGKSLNRARATTTELSFKDEMEVVVQSLKPNVMSKLTLNDCKRFNMLLEDVFPQTNLNIDVNEEFRNKIVETFKVMGLCRNERQVDKCIELYEQLSKRIGVAVLGPPSSGKSTVIAILKSVLASMSKTIRTYIISPKSMERSQLLGYLDTNTRQWYDGVLTQTAIAVNSEPPEVTSWIICDGDVDPEWIEALNSVLDDNKLLTLPSGWRIQFGNNVNFIFETHDLINASPATISRMGIIKFSAEDLPAQSLIDPWIKLQPDEQTMQLLIEKHFDEIFKYFERVSKGKVNTITAVKSILNTMTNIDSSEEFVVEMLKACNGMLEPAERNKFTNTVLDKTNVYVSNPLNAEFLHYNKFRNLTDTYITDDVSESTFSEQIYKTVLFKTASVKANCDLLRNILKNNDRPPFVIAGPNGTGKTLIINAVVSEFSGYQLVTVNCSAQLSASQVLHILKANCLVVSGIRGKEYKPKLSRLVLFMKNIDLCPLDSWGTSEVIELLLQIINRNGFYSDNLEWVSISGLQVCGTLSDLKKQNLSARFLSRSNIILTSFPNESDMQNIIMSFLSYTYSKFKNNSIPVKKDKLAEIILDSFNEIKKKFTPAMSNHYKFTPKMIEQWIVGLSFYHNDHFAYGFFYEFVKIFGDRLMTMEHLMMFSDIVRDNLKYFSIKFDVNETFFMQTSAKSSQLQMIDSHGWKDMIEKNLPICNSETAMIDLPVTQEIEKSVASVVRALSRPGTNICLAGKLGSGRFESVVLACTILNIKIFYPQVTRNYTINDFSNDLKIAMQTCALENEVSVLYVDHVWINYVKDILKSCEAILEDSFNNDNLFGDDLETLASSLKGAAQLEGYQDSLVSFFLHRVRSNLHLVVSLETTSSNFQEILKTFKSLYTKTEFVWFQDISVHTKASLCESVIKLMKNDPLMKFSGSSAISTKYYENVINDSGVWIDSPKRSIQLIKAYYLIHLQNEKKQLDHKNKLECGIQKLSEAYKYVAKLKEDAKEKEKALAEKRQLANQALEMISNTMKNANEQKTDMLKLKSKTEENGDILKERKIEIEKELSLVEPLLKEASAAVGSIKTEALSEIRSLRAPPETIRDILEGVLRLMGIRDTSWNSMKSFLAKRGIKEDIRSLNPSLISPENCTEVERLIEMKSESFDYRNAKRASAAAAPLASWVVACVKYSKVVQSIKPLEREQQELQRNLEFTENQMKSLSTGIDDVNVKVKELSEQLNGYTQEAAVLEIKLEETRSTLKSTEILVEKLSSEYSNWTEELENIIGAIKNLDKQSILTALCLTHFSHMLEEEKSKYIENINETLHMNFTLHETLYTDQDKLVWESIGLSSDKQSAENASLLTKFLDLPFTTGPIPLLLDPTGSASKWLVEYLKSQSNRKFEVLNQNDDRFTYNLELGVRFGKIVIIEDVSQHFTASLLSLIAMKIHSRFNKKMMHIGNKLVDLHEDFRLILISSTELKHLNGEINANVTIIPFTLTSSGLTDQLLSKWISMKHPDTEKKRVELLQNEGRLMQQKIQLQDRLLEELSHAEGDILKNEKLLATLNQIKESSVDIERSLTESHDIRVKLLDDYNQFKEICSQSASFYVGISRIYEINAKSFSNIFLEVLDKQKDYGDFTDPFVNIVKKTYLLLNRSVKKAEQVELGLNICKCAFTKKVPDIEWELFIFNFADSDSTVDPNIPKWVKKELTTKLSSLKTQHSSFYQKLNLENDFEWQNFVSATDDVDKTFPNIQMSEFQKLLVYQIFRPDHLLSTINQVTSNILGLKNDAFSQSGIKQLLTESNKTEPILVIASNGADPTSEIKEFAKSSIGADKYQEIYAGKGQENNNLNLVQRGAEKGEIICVKNVHLMPQIMQKIDLKLKSSESHEKFKLIYVCETDQNIPKNVLNKCKRLLMEPPNGIKHKIFHLLEQHQAIVREKRDHRHMKLFLALFILHSILQERRNFIPQGWCKWYEFGDADVKAAIDFILAVNGKSLNLDWAVLKGLMEKVVYGGRVDNVQDFEKLITHVNEYFDNKIMSPKWMPKSLNISIPNSNNFEEYQNVLMKIDSNDAKPEMFGLSSASSVSRNITFCRNLLKNLRKIYFNIDDSENYEKRIKPLMSLWKKSLNTFNIASLQQIQENSANEVSPWRLFKSSEVLLANELVMKISETLAAFSSIDLNSISDNDKNVLLKLSDNIVPYEWRKLWQGPKLASEFLKSVTVRVQNVSKFVDDLDEKVQEIDFSKIFNVDSFLSTVKLITSRQFKVSTSNLILESFTDPSKYEKMKLEQVTIVTVAPLLIDGLNFENSRLVQTDQSASSTNNYTTSIYIYFKEETQNPSDDGLSTFAMPLYATYSREKFLCTIKLSTSLERDDIVYSGASLVIPSN